MSEAKDSLEGRINDVPRTVKRRLKALEKLPYNVLTKAIDTNPVPTIIYQKGPEDYCVVYSNIAAIKQLGYPFEEILGFKAEDKLDPVLGYCKQVGWDEISDVGLSLVTGDKKDLLLKMHMQHQDIAGSDYWIANLDSVDKVDPKTFKGKMKRALNTCQKAFTRDRTYVRAPEYATAAMNSIIKETVVDEKRKNLVIDFKKTTSIDDELLNTLQAFGKQYTNRLFMVNVGPEVYSRLREYNVKGDITQTWKPKLSFNPA